tara:strand:+ start:176 stop:583 length:408 start_codon:yes stop_codon:yes gene_type:complete
MPRFANLVESMLVVVGIIACIMPPAKIVVSSFSITCIGLCEVIVVQPTIFVQVVTFVIGLGLIFAGRRKLLSRYFENKRGPFRARRVSGVLGEVGDLDFHTPPTGDAPTSLVESSSSEQLSPNGSDSDYKNPFDF